MTPPEESEATSEEDGLLLQKKLMDDVSEARPLAKLQEALEEESSEIAETETTRTRTETGNSNSTAETTETVTDESGETIFESDSSPASSDSEESQARRKPVLNNEDHELDRLAKVSLDAPQLLWQKADSVDLESDPPDLLRGFRCPPDGSAISFTSWLRCRGMFPMCRTRSWRVPDQGSL